MLPYVSCTVPLLDVVSIEKAKMVILIVTYLFGSIGDLMSHYESPKSLVGQQWDEEEEELGRLKGENGDSDLGVVNKALIVRCSLSLRDVE